MRLDGSLDIYNKIDTPDPSGEGLKNYALVFFKNIAAGIQPTGLKPAQLEQWGITDLSEGAKRCFVLIDESIVVLQHAVDKRTGLWYEIRSADTWPNHMELILVPTQGGQE